MTQQTAQRNGSALPNKSGNKPQKAQRGHKKHKKENFLCLLWLRFVPLVYLPRFAGQSCQWCQALLAAGLMPASYPANARVRRGAYAIPELRHMMLKVPKANKLMFYF